MKYPKVLTAPFYTALRLYYKYTGIYNKKVLIRSTKGVKELFGKFFPTREFTILSKGYKEMAGVKVAAGAFEQKRYHYCVVSDLVVKNFYRRRGLGSKLIQASVLFCEEEGFDEMIAFIRKENAASQDLFEKCGFAILEANATENWMGKEAELYAYPVLVAHYKIKKPAP